MSERFTLNLMKKPSRICDNGRVMSKYDIVKMLNSLSAENKNLRLSAEYKRLKELEERNLHLIDEKWQLRGEIIKLQKKVEKLEWAVDVKQKYIEKIEGAAEDGIK